MKEHVIARLFHLAANVIRDEPKAAAIVARGIAEAIDEEIARDDSRMARHRAEELEDRPITLARLAIERIEAHARAADAGVIVDDEKAEEK